MKIVNRPLILVLLLVFLAPFLGGKANASPPPASDLPFTANLPVCLERAPLLGLPQQSPPALQAVIKPPSQRCGACSPGDCAGSAFFSRCGGVANFVCVDSGTTCSADGLRQCFCGLPQ
jgi:hypothetical protein